MIKTIKLSNCDEFLLREITLFKDTPEEYKTYVGSTALSYVLMHDDNEIPEWEKEEVDEMVVFFVEPMQLIKMTDEQLTEYVTKQITQ